MLCMDEIAPTQGEVRLRGLGLMLVQFPTADERYLLKFREGFYHEVSGALGWDILHTALYPRHHP